MNIKQMEIQMIIASTAMSISNEIIEIVTKSHPKIYLEAVCNSIKKHPDLWTRIQELAKEKTDNAKVQEKDNPTNDL